MDNKNTDTNTDTNTYERVKDWNIKCGKPAPDYMDDDFFNTIQSQLQCIKEEANETIDAIECCDELEILDGICDLDVTINGLFYMAGYAPDSFVLRKTTDYLGEESEEIVNASHQQVIGIIEAVINVTEDFDNDPDYILLYTSLNILLHYARHRYYDYDSAIKSVLDNNDTKYYNSEDALDSLIRASELQEITDEEHRVEVTLADGFDGDINCLELDDLIRRGAVFSVHRVRDNKVCKPSNFEEVDLLPYI